MTTSVDLNDAALASVTPATLIACALAREGKPFAGMDAGYVHRTHDRARAAHTDDDLLSWPHHVDAGMRDYTWSWARRATRTHFGEAEGIEDLPSDYTQLPTTLTATVAL